MQKNKKKNNQRTPESPHSSPCACSAPPSPSPSLPPPPLCRRFDQYDSFDSRSSSSMGPRDLYRSGSYGYGDSRGDLLTSRGSSLGYGAGGGGGGGMVVGPMGPMSHPGHMMVRTGLGPQQQQQYHQQQQQAMMSNSLQHQHHPSHPHPSMMSPQQQQQQQQQHAHNLMAQQSLMMMQAKQRGMPIPGEQLSQQGPMMSPQGLMMGPSHPGMMGPQSLRQRGMSLNSPLGYPPGSIHNMPF